MRRFDQADPLPNRSHLFVLRIWFEDLGKGKSDWRGKIQYIDNGEMKYFRDWPTLQAFLENHILRTDHRSE
jgi:hypothetical protein